MRIWGTANGLVVTVMACVSIIPVMAQEKTHSTAQTVTAKKDGRAYIDVHAAEWLRGSDVPSLAVAYIEGGKVGWTAVYGEQSPRVAATERTLYNMGSLTKPITAEIVLRLASTGKLSLDESMSPFWLDPDIKDDP